MVITRHQTHHFHVDTTVQHPASRLDMPLVSRQIQWAKSGDEACSWLRVLPCVCARLGVCVCMCEHISVCVTKAGGSEAFRTDLSLDRSHSRMLLYLTSPET